jgi:putative tryptophan/tyrosine transport system substrate-binding protein
MKAKLLVFVLPALVLTTIHLAEAQQATNILQIGYLEGGPLSAHTARMEAFRQGLRELGYEEGKNIGIEWRFGDGKVDRLSALATELVGLKVAVIVTGGTGPTRAAKDATSTIPIVMAQDNDPVASGVVASLARPGGNITGLSNFAPELSSKRLEILREVVPKLSRVAVLGSSTGQSYALVMKELELAAKVLGVKLQYLDILEPKDVETAFGLAAKERADGVTTFASALVVSQRAQIVELRQRTGSQGFITIASLRNPGD